MFKKILKTLLFSTLTLLFMCTCADAEEDYPEVLPVCTVRIEGELLKDKEYSTCTVVFENADGTAELTDFKAQWRGRGYSTARADKKPYTVKLSRQESVFGMAKARKWILLANAYDTTLIRNSLALDLASLLRFEYTPSYRFAELYVNGEYVGSYMLTEEAGIDSSRLDLHMSEDEFLLEIMNPRRVYNGVSVTTPLFNLRFRVRNAVYIPQSQMNRLNSFLKEAEECMASGDRDRISEIIDLDSFLDAYILHELVKDSDVGSASTRFYIKGGRLYAGPMWDFDLSMGNDTTLRLNQQRNGTIPLYTDGWYACQLWWEQLVKCEWFLEDFAERYLELQPCIINLFENNTLGENRIDETVSTIKESIDHNYTVWDVTEQYYHYQRIPEGSYEESVEAMRSWLRERNDWILSRIHDGRAEIILTP